MNEHDTADRLHYPEGKQMFQACLSFAVLLCLFSITDETVAAKFDATRVAKSCADAIVTIEATGRADRRLGQGTGFITADGAVLTNYHVIAGFEAGKITFKNGQSTPVAGILFADPVADIAVLSVDVERKLVGLALKRGDAEPGTPILVIGTPLGLEQSLSTGVVAARRKDDRVGNVLQITAPISPGSSGSPVLDADGSVVGMVRSTIANGQNLNIAVPSSALQSAIASRSATPLPPQKFTAELSSYSYLPLKQLLKNTKLPQAADVLREHIRLHPFAADVRMKLVAVLSYPDNATEQDIAEATSEFKAAYEWRAYSESKKLAFEGYMRLTDRLKLAKNFAELDEVAQDYSKLAPEEFSEIVAADRIFALLGQKKSSEAGKVAVQAVDQSPEDVKFLSLASLFAEDRAARRGYYERAKHARSMKPEKYGEPEFLLAQERFEPKR